MALLGARMRRYVSCACSSSASDNADDLASCADFHGVTCGPLAGGRRRRKLSRDEVEAWLDDLSTVADCDASRSFLAKNNEVRTDFFIPLILLFKGGSVAEWLACCTQAHKGPGSNRSRDAVG